jgi:class 3 adenylate cyclase
LRLHISPTVVTVLVGLVSGSALLSGLALWMTSLDLAKQNTAHRLRDVTTLVAERIDANLLAGIRDPDQIEGTAFRRIHAELNRAARSVEGARFAYTLRRSSGGAAGPRYLMVVDGTPQNSGEFQPPGDPVQTGRADEAIHRVWRTGRFEAERHFTSDRYGTYLSGFLPLRRRDGSFEAVLGIDITPAEVERERFHILRTLAGGTLLSLLVVVPAAVLLGRFLSRPLRQIERQHRALARLEFDEPEQDAIAGQWVVEIHAITATLDNLRGALQEFNRYVPSTLVRRLVSGDGAICLDGETRDLAIMFTDIIGFTSITEHLPDKQTLKLLNEYFTVIHEAARSTEGVLDKYIGDAALLFWGAPDPIEQPARRCVEAALLCLERLDQLNRSWAEAGIETRFQTGFGLDFGDVLVGNMGAPERVNYTIVGDRVNLCSRLEHENRRLGTSVLATRALVDALGEAADAYRIVRIGEVRLRGLSQEVEIFEIRGRRLDGPEAAPPG